MADNYLEAIIDRVVTTLELIDGTGDFINDLSDGESVQWMPYTDPPPKEPTPGFPMLQLLDISEVASETGTSTRAVPLGSYFRTVTIGFVGFVVDNETKNTQNHAKAAARLAQDMRIALETNITLSGSNPTAATERMNITNLIISQTGAPNAPGYGRLEGEIETGYMNKRAAGTL